MADPLMDEDAYADDIAVWEELKRGTTYTVEELKDEVNDVLTAYTVL